jgi:hypothetical protein
MCSEEREIAELSHKIVELERRRDADGLERYITDDYVGVDPSGALITKAVSVGRYCRNDFPSTAFRKSRFL